MATSKTLILEIHFVDRQRQIGGTLADRIGRRPILLGVTVLTLVTAYPVMLWLTHNTSFAHLLVRSCGCPSSSGCTTALRCRSWPS